jgi:hypothetical protein
MFWNRKKDGKFRKGGKPWNKGKKTGSVAKVGKPQSKHAIDTLGQPFLKVFAIGDLHWDKQRSKVVNYKPTLEFLKDWGPVDVLLFPGDIWDLSFLAHWNSDRFDQVGHNYIADTIVEEAKGMQQLLKEFIDAAQAKKVVYMIGNHEAWLPMYLNKYDQVHSHLGKNTLAAWLDFKGLGIEEIPQYGNYTLGHMTMKHGETYGTENPAKRAIERSHRSMFFWHFHRLISWPGYTDVDATEKIQAYAVPGFCSAASMDYMKKAANNWSNGFLLGYVKPSGHFTPHIQVVSPRGNFIYNDKEYCDESK